MTTIAYLNGIVAADSQETWQSEAGGASKHRCVKLYRKTVPTPDGKGVEDVIIATAGATYSGMVFVDWFGSNTEPPETLTQGVGLDEDFDCLIITPRGVFVANRMCRPIKLEDEFISVGSGRKAAIAAMMCGKSAVEAVEIACRVDPYTSGPVVSMSLDVQPKKRRRKLPQPMPAVAEVLPKSQVP